ncbi:VapE domain-containing protein [Arsenophonus nasoniae]|uniref:DNA primase TraC n=1 Tax=Arsenophonus nasoniae TaxID=638 RepID=A0A4P7L7L6_9GAMM|nr:VapE domain-containing protein [Arsenophonus nasoniae]QBY47010.1 DNA primase TraC [Arsenophonus nasoniae]WGM09198.1 VapE family protein [Arsenophonus nasoniae]
MYPVNDICKKAQGQWEFILQHLDISTNRKESPCPACGGNTRYRFDDKEGRGTHHCSHCGAGDGLNLIMKVKHCTAIQGAKMIADVISLPLPERTSKLEEKPQIPIADKVIELVTRAHMGESKYLNNKGLHGSHYILEDGSLLLPLQTIEGTITGAQIIKPNGEKRMIAGTKKSRSFIPISKIPKDPDAIVITEGYATALTVNLLEVGSVFAAVDAGNLLSVAEAFREKYPNADIYIAGDNDVSNDGNVGKDAAEKAAKAVGGKFSLPKTDYQCDWNDYFQAKGIEELEREFNANLRIPLNKAGRPASKEKKSKANTFPHELNLKINERTGEYDTNLKNIQKAIKCHDVTGFQFSYDKFKSAEMVRFGEHWIEINDNTITNLRLRLDELGMPKVRQDEVRRVVNCVAEENSFDSGIDWITSLVWDGKPRVKNFFSQYFSAKGNAEYIEAVSKYTWTALAGRMMKPAIKADMVPIIYGEQGKTKSTGIEKMCPFDDAFVKIDLTKNDEDIARRIRGCVIAEWEELRGLSGRDSESTKAFISATKDKWIPKYREYAVTNPRRLIFIGTTNKQEILTDCTGNRRYLPLNSGQVNCSAIERDRDQLWAEALVLFNEHGIMWQKAEELAKKEHEQYRVKDSWEDDLFEYLEIGTKREMQFVSTEALFSRLGLMVGHTNRNHAERLKAVMSAFGYDKAKKRINGQEKRGYFKI